MIAGTELELHRPITAGEKKVQKSKTKTAVTVTLTVVDSDKRRRQRQRQRQRRKYAIEGSVARVRWKKVKRESREQHQLNDISESRANLLCESRLSKTTNFLFFDIQNNNKYII